MCRIESIYSHWFTQRANHRSGLCAVANHRSGLCYKCLEEWRCLSCGEAGRWFWVWLCGCVWDWWGGGEFGEDFCLSCRKCVQPIPVKGNAAPVGVTSHAAPRVSVCRVCDRRLWCVCVWQKDVCECDRRHLRGSVLPFQINYSPAVLEPVLKRDPMP